MRIPRNAHEPVPVGISDDQIHQLAQKVAQASSFSPGTPCASLIKKLGGSIEDIMSNDIVDADADVLIVYSDRDFVARIKNPFAAGAPVMNFELGIILGYYTLFFGQVRTIHGASATMVVPYFPKTKAQKACHAEAVQFAAAFLAPQDQFLDRWHRYAGDVTAVSQALGLPPKIIPRMVSAYKAPALRAG